MLINKINQKTWADNKNIEKRPKVVEIVGPAGVGKTTLVRALCQRNHQIQAGVCFHKTRLIPVWLGNILFWLPTFLRQYRHSRWFNRKELRSMAYLKLWHQILAGQSASNDSITVLDHGPIFRLAMLQEFGPEIVKSQLYERWHNTMLKEWAATLDLVIWLDAPDAILWERIQNRNCRHKVKGKSREEGYKFLAHYRRAYEQIIAELKVDSGIKVVCFNTDQESPHQIADRVLVALNAKTNED